jgi:DNA-binding transcriptional LysR family regulator
MSEPPYASPAVEVGLLYRRDRMGEPAVAWFLDLLAAAASVAAASALA